MKSTQLTTSNLAVLISIANSCAQAQTVAWPSCYDTNKNCDGVDFSTISDSMWHATLDDTSFVGSNWEGKGFGGSEAKNADFTNANLRGANVNHVAFDGSSLRNADLSDANFDHSSFRGVDLTDATYSIDTIFATAAFDPQTKFFDGKDWVTTSFFTSDLRGMKLYMDYQDITNMDFSPSRNNIFGNFSYCSFHDLTATGAKFTGNLMKGAWLQLLEGEGIDFTGSDLSDITCQHSNLKDAILRDTDISGAKFDHTSLRGADLTGATYSGDTRFATSSFDPHTTFFDGNDWMSTSFFSTDLKKMKLYMDYEDVTNQDYSSNVNDRFQDFSGCSFHGMIGHGAKFRGNDFTGAWLQVLDAEGIDFTGSILSDVTCQHSNLNGAILKDANLSGTRLEHTQLKEADLTGATISESTAFARASFDPKTKFPDGNHWVTTSFFTSDLRDMKLVLDFEDISNLDFSASADARFSDFSSSSFHSMTAHGAKFRGNVLSSVSMGILKADDIDFTGSDLTNTVLHYSNIPRADFSNAKLSGTKLAHTDMRDCCLVGADFRGADVDLDTTNMSGCNYNAATLFDTNFSPSTWDLTPCGNSDSACCAESVQETDDYGCERRLLDNSITPQRMLQEGPTCTADPNSGLSHSDLLSQKWGITDPTFDHENLDFALCYGISDMISDSMAQYTLYHKDCVTTATPNALTVTQIMSGVAHDAQGGKDDRTQQIKLGIDPTTITDSNLFFMDGNNAKVEFCVRNQLFTQDGAVEVNFLETVVTLTVDLTDCFSIQGINVKPLNKDEQSTDENFELRGFLCNSNNIEITTSPSFSQGSAIRICVTPNDEARQNSIYMRYLESFAFESGSMTQDAIVGPNQVAPIGLTSIECNSGDLICSFDTILTARFYANSGTVNGSGSAAMQFGSDPIASRRHLGRSLQQANSDNGPSASFDMELNVENGMDDFRPSSSASDGLRFGTLCLIAVVATTFFLHS